MPIAGNLGNSRCNPGAGEDRNSFLEHYQRMKEFRLAHPRNWRQWGCGGSGLRENPLALPRMILVGELVHSKHSPN